MKIDLRGRVTNLRLGPRACLHPLFEAISNSIHAIESRAGNGGTVRIRVERNPAQAQLPIQDLAPITSFHVEDTGIGFTEENYDGQGYFHFNPNRNAYVEIMDYRKVLRDAQRRNRILFKKLGLPSA